MKEKSCYNCIHRCFSSMFGIDYCYGYEVSNTEKEAMEMAADCTKYKEGIPACLEDKEYTPSSSNGDYNPSCPWKAPGMSISDFI